VTRRSDHLLRNSGAVLQRRAGATLAAALLVIALAACGASAQGTSSTTASPGAATAAAPPAPAKSSAEAPCGALAAQTRANAAGSVARRIYGREVSSPEVRRDEHQVEAFGPLLSALATDGTSASSGAAVGEAVTSLVFSHTHVVRLRVSRGGAVLADVGGPYILAPVGGGLRFQGRTVGHYLLSVQDDSGYAKLETRYIGYPLLIRQGSRRLPVEGTIFSASTAIPDSGQVSFAGADYRVLSFAAQAFPSGPLQISVLVPRAASSKAGCTAIKVSELNRIAERIWRRFMLVGAPVSAFISTMGSNVGVQSYVRAGSRQLAGSTSPGPRRLPTAGSVTYQGLAYRVASFAARVAGSPVRVYQLVSP
jgi:hypothetical protein